MNRLTGSQKKVGVFLAILIAAVYLSSVFIVPSASAYSASPQTLKHPKLVLRPFTSSPGKSVKVTGLAFTPSSSITVTINSTTFASTTVATTTSNSTGGFVADFTVPSKASSGSYTVTATDGNGLTASNTLTVTTTKPELTVKSTGHSDGSIVTVSGNYWLPLTNIYITFRGAIVASPTSGSTGGFSTTFVVSDAPAGKYDIVVSDGTNSISRIFGVVSRILATPNKASPGSMITVNGTGFGQNLVVQMTLGTTTITTTPTTSNAGSFQVEIQIPSGLASGAYTLKATDLAANSATARVSAT